MSGNKNPQSKGGASAEKGYRYAWLRAVTLYFSEQYASRRFHWNGVLLGVCLLIAIIGASRIVPLFHRADSSVKPGEIDLSGEWKYILDDRTEFSNPKLDDSQWCSIHVPNAGRYLIGSSQVRPPNCPTESYPRSKMRNRTFWYRKSIAISTSHRWDRPAIFLGAIKRYAWVFWDGVPVGGTSKETSPSIIILSSKDVMPGTHVLAVRVESLDDQNPGIFHALERKVTLGELTESGKAVTYSLQVNIVEPLLATFFQLIAFLLLVFLIVRSEAGVESQFWLLLYFGTSCLYSLVSVGTRESTLLLAIKSGTFVAMSTAMMGFGMSVTELESEGRHLKGRVALIVCCFTTMSIFLFYSSEKWSWLAFNLEKTVVLYTVVYFIGWTIGRELIIRKLQKQRAPTLKSLDMFTLLSLALLHGLQAFDRIIARDWAIFEHLPVTTSILTVAVLGLSVEDYLRKQRHLAFLGRFVRKGLRQFLGEAEQKNPATLRVFRRRDLFILKVDICDSTSLMRGMPYGVRRLFLHLWYEIVDQRLAGKILFDRPEGDGSIYYVDPDTLGLSAKSILDWIGEIEGNGIRELDERFRAELRELMSITPELLAPMSRYLADYRDRTGHDFWTRQTRVRFAVVYGVVDEGLWGMASQSHYDLTGSVLALLARLEKEAEGSEVSMSAEFYRLLVEAGGLGDLSSRFEIEWREKDLKGFGVTRFPVLRALNKKREEAA